MPGDIVVVLRGKATCDMVLLQGTCLVEESMLSGEVRHVMLGKTGHVLECTTTVMHQQALTECVYRHSKMLDS